MVIKVLEGKQYTLTEKESCLASVYFQPIIDPFATHSPGMWDAATRNLIGWDAVRGSPSWFQTMNESALL